MKLAIAYSYLRFSSPEQAKGDSVRRQTELRDAWLAKNNVVLDTGISLRDEGISGFSGKHRENPDRHALAAFLTLVQQGTVARGSYLIVESLDRLTREHIRPALTLLLNLIESGIRVVQLLPSEAVYDDNVEPMTLMMAIMELSRGHSESRMKSERVGRAWAAKKKRAAESREFLTTRLPCWLRADDGKIKIEPTSAKAVKRIFDLAISGYGMGQITKKLNAEVPPIGRAEYWARSYVAKILHNRAVFGEYQPHTELGGQKRKPEGDAVRGYFPVVVTEKRFYAAQAALNSRRNSGGRPSNFAVNIFAGLLVDARNGGPMIMRDAGKKGGGKIFVPYYAAMGKAGSVMASFPFAEFETEVLKNLHELDYRKLLPKDETQDDEIPSLEGRKAEVDTRLANIRAKLVSGGSIDALADAAKDLQAEKERLSEELNRAKERAAVPLEHVWGECRSLIDLLTKNDDSEDVRTKLRGALRRLVSSMYCLFIPCGRKRAAVVQVVFAAGGESRFYLIVHHPAHSGFQGRTERRTESRSMRYGGSVDLRKSECLEKLEETVRNIVAG